MVGGCGEYVCLCMLGGGGGSRALVRMQNDRNAYGNEQSTRHFSHGRPPVPHMYLYTFENTSRPKHPALCLQRLIYLINSPNLVHMPA